MATKNETRPESVMMREVKEQDFASMKDSIELKHGIYFLFFTVFFFQMVNWIIKSHGPPKTLKDDEWKWRNLFVSWVHAIIVSVWCLLSMLLYPELFTNFMLHINYFTYFNVCLATGYFWYDFLDIIVNNQTFKCWEVLLHHVAVAGMFYYNIHMKRQIGFNIIAIVVEFNSMCLHWRKLLQMVQTPYNSRKYLIIKYLNFITFVLFRFGGTTFITTSIYFYIDEVTTPYFIGICASMFVMNILNPILFWRLFKSDILRGPGGTKSTAMATLRRDMPIILWGHSASSSSSAYEHVRLNGFSKENASSNNNIPESLKDKKGD